MESVGFQLFVIAVIPMLVAVVLYFFFQKRKIRERNKQIIIGIIFGIIAICGTEFGVNVNGAIINARDAAPLCAALIFGGPAGIIAGFIGGIERWISVYWTGAYYTRVGCSISTILAGFIGAFVRRYLHDDNIPETIQALIVGFVVEVIHMTMIFVTNMNDVRTAFIFVEACSIPMIVANSLSVAAAVFMIRAIDNNDMKQRVISGVPSVSEQIQRRLSLVIGIGFLLAGFFNFLIQEQAVNDDIRHILKIDISDAINDVERVTNVFISRDIRNIREELSDSDEYDFESVMNAHNVSEINIINENKIITASSDPRFIGYDMTSSLDTYFLVYELDDDRIYIQELRGNVLSSHELRKYAVIRTSDGYIEIGYDFEDYHDLLEQSLSSLAINRHIGESGSLIVADYDGDIVSETNGLSGNVDDYLEGISFEEIEQNVVFEASAGNDPSYLMAIDSEGYKIIGVYPKKEADFSKHFSVYLTTFMETIVFGILYLAIFGTVNNSVVKNVIEVSDSLGKISDGDLNTVVDVRSNKEFISLSSDINKTVDKLKSLISEANERIDSELRYAKEIQHAALPRTFPPYPNRHEFDIYALMDPAKEVGGDFYDFYLLDASRLLFLIADVSGKGIPASLFMMRAKTVIRKFAERGFEVNEILTKANRDLSEGNDADMFVTVWIGILDLRNGELKYANAGHNPPLFKKADGNYEYLRCRKGFILAGIDDYTYQYETIMMKPGDEIFLYTDGVVESINREDEQYGEARLNQCINRNTGLDAKQICEKIRQDVDVFSAGAERFDDITEVSLRFLKYMDENEFSI